MKARRLLGLHRTLALSALATCAAWLPAQAQSQATTGVIEGTVSDPTGAVVPGAEVTLTHMATGFERKLITGESGFFRGVLLPLGPYRLSVSKSGFARLMLEGIEVTLGSSVTVNPQLKLGGSAEQVIVEAGLVSVGETETSGGLGERQLHGVPIASRNYFDLLTLTPNVAISQGSDGPQINVNGQKGVQTGFQVDGSGANNAFFGEQRGGQRPVANVVLEAVKEFKIVSVGAASEFGGYSGAFVNVVTKSGTNDLHGSLFHLQDLEALTAQLADGSSLEGFHREQFGGSIGGPILRDEFFYFGTYEGVFARYEKPNDLIHCCTVFNAGVASFAAPGAGGAPVDLGNLFSTRFASPEDGPIAHTNDLQAFLVKADWLPTPAHGLTFRHYFARSIQQNGTFDVFTFGRTANGEELSRSNAFITSWTWSVSSRHLNEFRFQFARENRPRQHVLPPDLPDTSIGSCLEPRDLAPPTVGCLGRNFRFGRAFFHPSFVIDDQYQFNDNFSWLVGKHGIKFGAQFNFIRIQNFFQGFARGRYTFSTVEGFLNYINIGPQYVDCSDGSFSSTGACPAGTFITGPLLLFLQFAPIGNTTLDQASNNNFNQFETGLFWQDTWQARPGLTLTYGLRWDNYNQRDPILPPAQTRIGQFLSNPSFPSDGTVPSFHKAFQPRLGIAWDPWNNGKQVIRANGGVFFSRLPALMVANGTANNGALGATIFSASFFNAFGLTPPAYPDCATGAFTPPACPSPPNFNPFDPSVVLFDRDFTYPRSFQWSVWGERELAPNWKVSAGFNYALSTHLNRVAGFNTPAPAGTGPDGRPLYAGNGPFSGPGGNGTGIATFSGLITSNARSLYRSVSVKVDRRYARAFLISAYYTYAHDLDDDSNERDQFTFQFSDPRDFHPERGPSARDRRHRFGLSTVWELPWGIQWSNTLVASSASPRSLLCNFDANGDSSAAGDRVFTDGSGNFSCGPAGAGRQIATGDGGTITLVGSLTGGRDTGRNTIRRNDEFFDWSLRASKDFTWGERFTLSPALELFNLTNNDNFRFPICDELRDCFLGTFLQIPGDSRRLRLGLRFEF